LFIGSGIGLLFSPDNGATWQQMLPAYLTNNSFLTNDVIWKVGQNKFRPATNKWLFSLGDTIYTIVPGLANNFTNPANKLFVPHPNNHGWLDSRIRDFELSDSLYSDSLSKNYHAICFSTDGFYREGYTQNAELFYQFRYHNTNFYHIPSQLQLPFDSVNNFIEYIAIDQYTSGNNPDNLFFVAYREVSKDDPTVSWIHIGALKKSTQIVNDYSQLYYYEYYTTPVSNNFNAPFAGFGYRYNAFEATTKLTQTEFVVGATL